MRTRIPPEQALAQASAQITRQRAHVRTLKNKLVRIMEAADEAFCHDPMGQEALEHAVRRALRSSPRTTEK